MNQLQAFRDTLALARDRNMDNCSSDIPDTDYDHLSAMLARIEGDPSDFSEGKLGRWLGWAQASVVAGGWATLDEMKAINKANK